PRRARRGARPRGRLGPRPARFDVDPAARAGALVAAQRRRLRARDRAAARVLRRRGRRPRRARARARGRGAPRARGREDARGLAAAHALRHRHLLPDRDRGGLEQPRPFRRRALWAPRVRGARPRGDVPAHALGGLRRGGEAPDPARDLRALGRLLRRLLPQGAAGADAPAPRLRRRLPRLRPRRDADVPRDRLPARRAHGGPAAHVPLRRLHGVGEPRRAARPLAAVRAFRGAPGRAPVARAPARGGAAAARRRRLRARGRAGAGAGGARVSARVRGFEVVIGLEVHVQLRTRSKLFSPAPVSYGDAPNHAVHPICLALPGVLPVLNGRAVELAIRAGLATGCRVHERCVFARKNYFYPDLPKGYQISQYEEPLATGGAIDVPVEDPG